MQTQSEPRNPSKNTRTTTIMETIIQTKPQTLRTPTKRLRTRRPPRPIHERSSSRIPKTPKKQILKAKQICRPHGPEKTKPRIR